MSKVVGVMLSLLCLAWAMRPWHMSLMSLHSALLSPSWVVRGVRGLNQYYLSCRSWWILTRPWHTQSMEQITLDTRSQCMEWLAINNISALNGDIGISLVWIILFCTCYCVGLLVSPETVSQCPSKTPAPSYRGDMTTGFRDWGDWINIILQMGRKVQ